MGYRIRSNEQGNPPSSKQLILRFIVLYILGPISILFILFSKNNSSLHDLFSKTTVVRFTDVPLLSTPIFILINFTGLLLFSFQASYETFIKIENTFIIPKMNTIQVANVIDKSDSITNLKDSLLTLPDSSVRITHIRSLVDLISPLYPIKVVSAKKKLKKGKKRSSEKKKPPYVFEILNYDLKEIHLTIFNKPKASYSLFDPISNWIQLSNRLPLGFYKHSVDPSIQTITNFKNCLLIETKYSKGRVYKFIYPNEIWTIIAENNN